MCIVVSAGIPTFWSNSPLENGSLAAGVAGTLQIYTIVYYTILYYSIV